MRPQVCLLTNPVWVIKTRLQLQRSAGWLARPGMAAPAAARRYRGVVHAAREIAREEGLQGFYRGIWPSLLLVQRPATCICLVMVPFMHVYAACMHRETLRGATTGETLSWLEVRSCIGCCQHALSQSPSSFSGVRSAGRHHVARASESATECPRTWVTPSHGDRGPNRAPARAPRGARSRRTQPWQTLTWAPTLRQVSHGAIQFMVYEDLKERATRPAAGASRAPPSSAEITAIGAVSKLAASIATYPSQARWFCAHAHPAAALVCVASGASPLSSARAAAECSPVRPAAVLGLLQLPHCGGLDACE